MKADLPNCPCGGQPVIYNRLGITIIKCSECSQFVTEYGEEQAKEEWRMRVHEQRNKLAETCK